MSIQQDNRSEIDLADVFKRREADGLPFPESSATLNPVATFVDEPDACLEMLMRGAAVSYLSVELYDQAKRKGLEVAKHNPPSIKTLVDAWYAEPLLTDLAQAVDQAFLPK